MYQKEINTISSGEKLPDVEMSMVSSANPQVKSQASVPSTSSVNKPNKSRLSISILPDDP